MKGNLETLEALLALGADPLHKLAGGGHDAEAAAEIVPLLVELDANVKIRSSNDSQPVHMACLNEDPCSTIEVLLRYGASADINEPTAGPRRLTSLTLLAAIAPTRSSTPDPVKIATGYGQMREAVRSLRDAGADVTVRDADNRTEGYIPPV